MGQFKPGESGNPSGRPKGAKGVSKAYLNAFAEYVVSGGGYKFIECMNNLKPEDYVNAFLELLKFTSTEKGNVEAVNYLIKKLINHDTNK